MDSNEARERISDAADEIAEDEKNDQETSYPQADRSQQIKETAGD